MPWGPWGKQTGGGGGLPFTWYQQDVETEASATITTVPTVFQTLTTPAGLAAGRYMVTFYCETGYVAIANSVTVELQVDGVVACSSRYAPEVDVSDTFPRNGFRVVNLTAGVHTLTINSFITSGTASCVRRRINLIRLS